MSSKLGERGRDLAEYQYLLYMMEEWTVWLLLGMCTASFIPPPTVWTFSGYLTQWMYYAAYQFLLAARHPDMFLFTDFFFCIELLYIFCIKIFFWATEYCLRELHILFYWCFYEKICRQVLPITYYNLWKKYN